MGSTTTAAIAEAHIPRYRLDGQATSNHRRRPLIKNPLRPRSFGIEPAWSLLILYAAFPSTTSRASIHGRQIHSEDPRREPSTYRVTSKSSANLTSGNQNGSPVADATQISLLHVDRRDITKRSTDGIGGTSSSDGGGRADTDSRSVPCGSCATTAPPRLDVAIRTRSWQYRTHSERAARPSRDRDDRARPLRWPPSLESPQLDPQALSFPLPSAHAVRACGSPRVAGSTRLASWSTLAGSDRRRA